MRFILITLAFSLFLFQCKPTLEDEYTQTLNKLIAKTDSLDQLINSVEIDSFRYEIQSKLEELEWCKTVARENDTLQKQFIMLNTYRNTYACFDSCLLAYGDFFDELHLVHYDLERTKEQYISKGLSKEEVIDIIEQDENLLDEINMRISERFNAILTFKQQAGDMNHEVSNLVKYIRGD